jgi:opacity protein-like surface antigen
MKALSIALALGGAILAGSAAEARPETAKRPATLFGRTSASVTYGPHIRLEAGRGHVDLADPNWLPPGPSDPRVFFDFPDRRKGFAGVAFGYDWQNGFRGDIGLISAGKVDTAGAWSYTIPADPGPHADISAATVTTRAVMASVFYAPLEQQGVNSRIQPYLVAGLGLAQNKMSNWTRTNASSPKPVRRARR